jgi:SAM-dependent methyltransferase
MSASTREQRLSFGTAATHYDSIRPTYAAEAVAWLFGEEPRLVVDLGAGTGIFSRMLAAAGHEVTAVEPDALMRDRLIAVSPGVTAVAGSAEGIPLPDESVDAVAAAQAYHWFDRQRAHPEIARVLRPGSVFGPLWNIRDESVSWIAALGRAASLEDGTTGMRFWHAMPDAGPWFGRWERGEFRHTLSYSPTQLLDLVHSRSTWLAGDENARRRIDDGVTAVIADLPDPVEVPYITIAYRVTRR